jgi:carbon-monoxide dehydrogenase small subunit
MGAVMKTDIAFTLNGTEVKATVTGSQRLIDLLRGPLRLTGTKEGCGEGECGACTVLVDCRPINACLYPAAEIENRSVITVEGLAHPPGKLSVVQQAFVDCGAIQCGFCTPGMIMSATALLDEHPRPTDEQIRTALLGNLCRCTGYVQIIEAVRKASVRLGGGP